MSELLVRLENQLNDDPAVVEAARSFRANPDGLSWLNRYFNSPRVPDDEC